MRIGELSTRSGLSRDTIRFYERNGLISSVPGKGETNNYREYSEDNLKKLAFYAKGREAGVSIADLKEISAALENNCDIEIAKSVIRSKIVQLKERRDQISTLVQFLEQSLSQDE